MLLHVCDEIWCLIMNVCGCVMKNVARSEEVVIGKREFCVLRKGDLILSNVMRRIGSTTNIMQGTRTCEILFFLFFE